MDARISKLCDDREKSLDEKMKLQDALVGALEDLAKGPSGTARESGQARGSATTFDKSALAAILSRAKNG